MDMDQDGNSSFPTQEFIEMFENAGGLYAQYCRQDTGTARQELAHKAVSEVGFIELEELPKQILAVKLMAYHEVGSAPRQVDIIIWAWQEIH